MKTPRPNQPSNDTRADHVIAERIQAQEAGLPVPPLEELIARHPQLAAELCAYFENEQRLERRLAPLRDEAPLAVPAASDASGAEAALPVVPGYEILGVLGRGGMGVVYKAQQRSPERLVALKMILSGASADPEELSRFRGEAEAIARIQHPNIVQVYEVGTHQGLPYFSMEYVEGGTLADKVSRDLPEPRQAAAILSTLATAVHETHQRGIVHRDLKPANVLMKGGLMPKITDFGLAKRLDVDLGQTGSGAVVGTPSYMAPEQARGESRQATPATDVYALGAVLYELLTGKPPFRATTALDTLMQVLVDEPVPVRRMQPRVPRDLETICLKCLEKKAEARYASAQALADDLKRFREKRPITARPLRVAERVLRWGQRRPATAALILVTALAALAGVIGLGVHLQAMDDALTSIKSARDEEQRQKEIAREREQGERSQRLLAEHHAYSARMNLARIALVQGDARQATALLRAQIPQPGQPDLRDFEWYHLWRKCHRDSRTFACPGNVTAVVFGNADRWLVAGGSTAKQEAWLRVWDVRSGAPLHSLSPPGSGVGSLRAEEGRLTFLTGALQLNPDRTIARARVTSWVWDGKTLLKRFEYVVEEEDVAQVCLSPDGKLMAIGNGSGTVRIWNTEKQTEEQQLKGHQREISALAFSPDGKSLASGGRDQKVNLWNLAAGKVKAAVTEHNHEITAVAFSPTGELLYTADKLGVVRCRILETWKEEDNPQSHPGPVLAFAFSTLKRDPVPAPMVSGGSDRVLGLWLGGSNILMRVFPGHAHSINALSFSKDGRLLASGSGEVTFPDEGEVKLWDIQNLIDEPDFPSFANTTVVSLALATNQSQIVIGRNDGEAWVMPPEPNKDLLAILKHRLPIVNQLVLSPDGNRLATVAQSSPLDRKPQPAEVTLWDTSTWRQVAALRGHSYVRLEICFEPKGSLLAVSGAFADDSGEVTLWDTTTGQLLKRLGKQKLGGDSIRWTPDGRTLISGGSGPEEAEVVCWDLATGQGEPLPIRLKGPGVLLALSPDGTALATASLVANEVTLWDLQRRQPRLTVKPSTPFLMGMGFMPQGRSLLTVGGRFDGQGRAVFWDVTTGAERVALEGHRAIVNAFALSRDGKMLITGGGSLKKSSSMLSHYRGSTDQEVSFRVGSPSQPGD